MGPWFKVSSERHEKPGIEPKTPGLQGALQVHQGGLYKKSHVMRKHVFAYAKSKVHISCMVNHN